MPQCSGAQGLRLCRSCLPRAAPSLPDAVAWKSSLWEWLCSALAAPAQWSRAGGVGLPGETLALCPLSLSLQLSGGEW